jgi:monofunctional chorismate mutase
MTGGIRVDELQTFREEIDRIDQEMLALFSERMAIVSKIADYKMAKDMIVYDQNREDEVVNKNLGNCSNDEYKPYYKEVLDVILRVSKEYQKQLILRSTL